MYIRIAIFALSFAPWCAQAQPPFPVVDKAAQQARDEDRRLILEAELADERDALSKANAQLDASPSVERHAEVHRHSENVQALLRELGIKSRDVPGQPALLTVKAVKVTRASPPRPTPSAVRGAGPLQFWNPYNRAAESTDLFTTSRRDEP